MFLEMPKYILSVVRLVSLSVRSVVMLECFLSKETRTMHEFQMVQQQLSNYFGNAREINLDGRKRFLIYVIKHATVVALGLQQCFYFHYGLFILQIQRLSHFCGLSDWKTEIYLIHCDIKQRQAGKYPIKKPVKNKGLLYKRL